MIDLEGVVVKPLAPEGVIKIRGELWNAVSCNGQAVTCRRVKVIRTEGLKLIVEAIYNTGEVNKPL